MNINKLFDNYLDITTKDNKNVHIERKKIVVHDSLDFYGEANIIQKNNDIYIIKEVYSLEKNRLRYSYIKLDNVKAYTTIEKMDDGLECPIYMIEKYDKIKTNVSSIGNIKKINSDKIEKINKKSNDRPLILKLLRRNKDGEVIKDLLSA